jgi:hypothetical protein
MQSVPVEIEWQKTSAIQQWKQTVVDPRDDAAGAEIRDSIAAAQLKKLCANIGSVQCRTMAENDALGSARRTGSVDDESGGIGPNVGVDE